MRQLKLIAAAAALVAGLCTATAASAGKLEDIQTAGVIKVGIALTGEPIGFRDASNKPVGYDVEVAKRLADSLGVKLEITEVSGAVRITMLQSGQIDVVIANMTANLERAKAVNFTIPYLRSGIKILTREDTGVKSLADLKGKKVIVGRGTTNEAMIKAQVPDAEMVYTESFAPGGDPPSAAEARRCGDRGFHAHRLCRQAERGPRQLARYLYVRSDRDWRRQGRSGIPALPRHVRLVLHLERRIPGELHPLVRPARPGAEVALVGGRPSRIDRAADFLIDGAIPSNADAVANAADARRSHGVITSRPSA